MKHLLIALLLSATVAAYSAAQATDQPPRIAETQLHTEPASTGLSATVSRFRQSGQQLWIGYAIPALPSRHSSSCSASDITSASDDGCCGEFQLERSYNGVSSSSQNTGPRTVYVLLRLDNNAITRVLTVNAGCRLNAGGIAFEWLTGVQPDDSARFLGALAAESTTNRSIEGPLAALAAHATPTATTILASLTTPANPPRLREKAAFWLGAERGHDGFLVLQKLIQSETDSELRKKLVFDLSINPDPAATDELLSLAKSNPDARTRGEAIFWLSQKAGKKSAAAIADAVTNDPDMKVKEKAIFALSQLPPDQGIPQLIHVADTSREPELRKKAMFWLGQSKDPRALQYIEAVLTR